MRSLVICLVTMIFIGCTPEYIRIAMENIPVIENQQDTVFKNLHEVALRKLYNDALQAANDKEVMQQIWQNRDKVEEWTVAWERARTLRLMTIDAAIISSQSQIDLFIKKLQKTGERINP